MFNRGTHPHRQYATLLATLIAIYTAVEIVGLVRAADADQEPAASHAADSSDLSKKAEILGSPEWRRAVFELGHWLDTQKIYAGPQVAAIKRDFNARVAKMSSFELRYLLDDLNAKFAVLDTPEARDARAWIGQYLSVASDSKRSEFLKDVPDVTKMSASDLANEIQKIELRKQQTIQQQNAFDQSRSDIVSAQQQSIAATQRAVASANRNAGSSYSPYRGGSSGGKQPFSDVKTGGDVHVTAGPFGAYVSF